MSRDRNDYKLDFNKRVFLRNRDLTKNTGLCNNKCPNAKEPFSNYVMSDNTLIGIQQVKIFQVLE